jgi:hypothetical protein
VTPWTFVAYLQVIVRGGEVYKGVKLWTQHFYSKCFSNSLVGVANRLFAF